MWIRCSTELEDGIRDCLLRYQQLSSADQEVMTGSVRFSAGGRTERQG